MARTRAVIDVGTNSVKILIAALDGGKVQPLHEASEQTRLGQGFYETHFLQRAAIEQTAKVVAQFVQEAKAYQPEKIRVIATSAARDATNREELERQIEQAAGLPLEVISGEQEADWAFQGVTSDPAFLGRHLLVMDVGGGSTEFILGRDSHRGFAHSFPLGTVRLLEKLPVSDPPTAGQLTASRALARGVLEEQVLPVIAPHIESIRNGVVCLVGTGGTTTILARMQLQLRRYDRDLMEGLVLTREQVDEHRARVWGLRLAERKHIIGLPGKRADVILMGTVIFGEVMEALQMKELTVSTRGLRFAAVRAD